MSANIKKTGRIGTKIVAGFLFLFLVMFNVEVGLYDGETSKSGIFGLMMNASIPDANAGGGSDPGDNDHCANVVPNPGCLRIASTFCEFKDLCIFYRWVAAN